MMRNYIVKAACLLMFIGFAAGVAGQVELLKPGISFMSPKVWSQLIVLHAWATPISLFVICLSTITLLGHRGTTGQWAVWLAFCTVPLLIWLLLNIMLRNAQSPDSYLVDTVYVTAYRHAFGTAILLVALGGLSAFERVKSKTLSLKISLVFAFLITISGVTLTLLQAQLGLSGMPRRYLDYPQEFAQLQFYSSVAAIACLCLSGIYLILLWLCSNEDVGKFEEVF